MHPDITHITPLILAGGKGTRLGTLCMPECPKPFVPCAQHDSLFKQTLRRVAQAMPPVVVGNAAQRDALHNHAHEAGVAPQATLLEHTGRNTAFAVAVAVHWMLQHTTPEAVVAILPADHAVRDHAAYHHTLVQAAQHALREAVLVLIGMQPDTPSRELGYMHADAHGVVQHFREKPEDAEALLAAGWRANSGQVVARVQVLAEALATHAPAVWHAAEQAVTHATQKGSMWHLADADCAPVSFDVAVLEQATNLRMVPSECGWSDVGSEAAFRAHAGLAAGAQVMPRIDRPWGYGVVLGKTTQTQSKELVIYPHKRISLQRHAARDEHWSVMEGEAEVTLNDSTLRLKAGEAVLVPRGVWHRLKNPTDALLRVHEVQSGHPDEADIERAEDDFGRV